MLLPLVFFWLFLAVLFFHFTQYSRLAVARVQLQNAADAAAYSMAVVQARTLNALTQLNQGIEHLSRAAQAIYATYLALRAAVSFFGPAQAALLAYERLARATMKQLARLAKAMAELQDAIRAAVPWLCWVEGRRIALRNGAEQFWVLPPPFPAAGGEGLSLWVERAGGEHRIGWETFPAPLRLQSDFWKHQKVLAWAARRFPAALHRLEAAGKQSALAQATVCGNDLDHDQWGASLEAATLQRTQGWLTAIDLALPSLPPGTRSWIQH